MHSFLFDSLVHSNGCAYFDPLDSTACRAAYKSKFWLLTACRAVHTLHQVQLKMTITPM